MEPATAILISAIFGTVGWYVTVRNHRMVDRRQHTYRVILRQLDDERFAAALDRIRAVLTKNDIPKPDNDLRSDDIQKIDYLLNHYEFLSAAIWCGDMDEKLIRSCEFSRMTKLYRKMERYIIESREFRDQTTMYENLEHITKRWLNGSFSFTHCVWEFWIWRPSRNLPRPILWVERAERAVRNFLCGFGPGRPPSLGDLPRS